MNGDASDCGQAAAVQQRYKGRDARVEISITVNGKGHAIDVPANALLSDILREHLGLTGTHVGCDTSQCGA